MVTWSYSSIKTFEQCPKKYYHLRVAKDIKDTQGPEANYGLDAHKAAENFIKFGATIPPKFKFMEPMLATLAALPGEKFCELKLGVRRTYDSFHACKFFDPEVWWRGVGDLVVINGSKAQSIDYKTGKNAKYADLKQLDLVAGAIFLHFPEVTQVKSALAYVVSNEFVKKTHRVVERDKYMNVFEERLSQLEEAYRVGVWGAKSSGLCAWCPVTSCPHWKARK